MMVAMRCQTNVHILGPFPSDASYPGRGKFTQPTIPPTGSTFDLTVICPPLIFGPWVHPLGASGLDSLNHSNHQIREIVRGDFRSSRIPRPFTLLWVDVRDVALAHVEAAFQLDPSEPSSNGRYALCFPEKFDNSHLNPLSQVSRPTRYF